LSGFIERASQRERIVQGKGANQPGGERSRGEWARGRTGKGAKKPDTAVHELSC